MLQKKKEISQISGCITGRNHFLLVPHLKIKWALGLLVLAVLVVGFFLFCVSEKNRFTLFYKDRPEGIGITVT